MLPIPSPNPYLRMASSTYTAQHEDARGKIAEKDTACARPSTEVIGTVVYTMKEKKCVRRCALLPNAKIRS